MLLLGLNYVSLGQYRRVIEILQPHIEALRGDLVRQRFEMASLPAVRAFFLGFSLARLGEFAAAARASEEALVQAIAMAADHPFSMASAWNGVGWTSAMRGNFHEAIPWLERSLDACRKENFSFISMTAMVLGTTYVRAGREADGIALLEEVAEPEGVTGFAVYRPERLAALAEAYLLSGRVEDALQTARQALHLSQAGKQHGWEADTLHLLGEIQARPGSPDSLGAEAFYREALALAGALGMRPLVARCHLGLGRLYRQAGQGAPAKEHLGTARTMLAQMEMHSSAGASRSRAHLRLRKLPLTRWIAPLRLGAPDEAAAAERAAAQRVSTATLVAPRTTLPASRKRTKMRFVAGSKGTAPLAATNTEKVGVSLALICVVTVGPTADVQEPVVGLV